MLTGRDAAFDGGQYSHRASTTANRQNSPRRTYRVERRADDGVFLAQNDTALCGTFLA